MIKAIAFDFDGVFVMDSDAVFKKKAWEIVFSSYKGKYEPFLAEAVLRFGSGKAGGRVEIIRNVYEKLRVPDAENKTAFAAAVFDDYVQKKILDAGLAAGAREALDELSKRGLSLYLNSGTATAALELSASSLNINAFFKGVLGSSKSKADNLQFIAEQERAEPSEVLAVGDGESDALAAQDFGCKFVGVANKWNNWASQKKPFPCIGDLREVIQFL